MDDETRREDIVYEEAIKSLHYGFFVAAGLFVVGVAWSVVERQALATDILPFQKIPGELLDGNPAAVIDLSILALMLTPVVTVLLIAINFYRLNERRYAVFALLVLVTLAVSIIISLVR
jgi:uncharacterized membrane protein